MVKGRPDFYGKLADDYQLHDDCALGLFVAQQRLEGIAGCKTRQLFSSLDH
jgi:hypothetical protein